MSDHDHDPELQQEVQRLDASVMREVAEAQEKGRHSTLDKKHIRAERDEVVRIATGGKPPGHPSLPLRVRAYLVLTGNAFEHYEATIIAHGAAASGAVRYSEPARKCAGATYGTVMSLRKSLHERLGSSPEARPILDQCGVGQELREDAPLDILDLANQQIVALKVAATQELLVDREVDAPMFLDRLEAQTHALKAEIDKGTGNARRKGEMRDERDAALLTIDIILSRLGTWLKDHDAKDAAEALERRIPRKSQRRASDRKDATPAQDKAQGGTEPPAGGVSSPS